MPPSSFLAQFPLQTGPDRPDRFSGDLRCIRFPVHGISLKSQLSGIGNFKCFFLRIYNPVVDKLNSGGTRNRKCRLMAIDQFIVLESYMTNVTACGDFVIWIQNIKLSPETTGIADFAVSHQNVDRRRPFTPGRKSTDF